MVARPAHISGMSDPTNPFAALSLIVAPAVLTNASSILVLSTSNRLARAIDRARTLATQLESPSGIPSRFASLRLKEVATSEERALLLLNALRLFYAALGAFAGAALTSLLGAGLLQAQQGALSTSLELVAVGAGFIGVAGLILGCILLLRETRIAVLVVSEEAALLREHFAPRLPP
jgi:hydroxymethylglutaryl-CoA reductase